MNEIEAFNRDLFLKMNGGDGTPAWLVQIAIGIADGLLYLIPFVLLWMWLWGDQAKRQLAIKVVLVAMLSLGANQLIGLVWWHPRPFMINLGHVWLSHVPDSSFPSDHMTVFASVGLTLLFDGATWLGGLILLMGLGVAWARVFLGVHFPLDMVGAVGVAAIVYAVVTPLWRRVGRPITDWVQRLYRLILAQPIAAGWIRR
ncbi:MULTISPECIES: phosphatase PAP2 family protein [Burkholderiales]|uniref:Undecaprenyl-diphosphatase BcrC n=2 Tax=Burkholderiales TaxID=80840 RepID=A0A6F8PCM7_COMTE|nr:MULTISPECIES: phosphatase PAP2 family protein [Burkholderiales]NDV73881.1 phosphatase PAP2 family protein [Burkholderia cenocepacia]BBJ01996.1 undecaprenyl-diphosphatase BcrC [Comamonas testosteroni]